MRASTDELELKARVEDPAAFERELLRVGAMLLFRGEMIDQRYDRGSELRNKDEVLRLRIYRPADGSAVHGVLGWKGRASVRDGYKHREEHETPVQEPEAALVILERLGYETGLRIDRTIVVYRLAGATVRIEWYPEMDVLVEVEGEPLAIERAVHMSGLDRESFVPAPLDHFVRSYEQRTGRTARLTR